MSTAEAIRRILDEASYREERAVDALDRGDQAHAHDEMMSASALLNLAVGLLEPKETL